ncbi:MAG: toll/interleukin-1 receptor domain-containing protein [Anaerolineales bacterium]
MPMKHSTFISYAWVDNEIHPGADNGWVSTFVDGLRKCLARELGRRDETERLWLDYEQMRGNESVTPTILAHLKASRTLVLILSNGYVTSPWCLQELATFVEKVGTDSGRIFVVRMSPVNQEEPEALRDLVKYSFCYQDERNQPRTRWFPCIDPTDREYSPEQQRLARDLAAKLRDKKTAPTPKPMPPAPPPGPAERFVLIDGGVEDRDLIRDIAKRLKQHNLGVAIPLSALADQSGIKSSALTRDLRTKLSLCDSVLMVYHRGPVDQVSKHLVECLKACTKAPKGRTPPTIDLCQTQSDPLALGLYPKGMRIHIVDEACADNCVEWFLDGRSPS